MEVAEVVAEVAPEVLVATRASNEENVGVTEVDILAVAVVVVGGLDLGVPDPDPCCSIRLETILGSKPKLCKALASNPISILGSNPNNLGSRLGFKAA